MPTNTTMMIKRTILLVSKEFIMFSFQTAGYLLITLQRMTITTNKKTGATRTNTATLVMTVGSMKGLYTGCLRNKK